MKKLAGLIFLTILVAAAAAPTAWSCDVAVHRHAHQRPATSGRPPLEIGDSTSLLAAPVLARLGIESDARGCRQFSAGLDIVRQRARAGTLPAVVVLALGANGPIQPAQMRQAVRIAGPSRVLALVTARQSPASDRAIRRAAAAHPRRVLVLDWVAYSSGHAGWFGGDGLHVGPDGARAYAQFIRQRIAPYAFPPVRRLRLPAHSSGAKPCGAVEHGRRPVVVVRGSVACVRARQLARRSPLRPAPGWRTYDWRRVHPGPWQWVTARADRKVIVATLR